MRWLAVALIVGACGGASQTATREPAAQPLPTPPAHDAGVTPSRPTTAGCLAPLEHALADPKFDPKPMDEGKLAEIDRGGGDPVEQAFARARLFFEKQHWVEAATGFRAIALEHADKDASIYATQLYLECLNILGSRGARSECYEDMARDLPTLRDLHCTTHRRENEEQCTLLDHIQNDLLRLQAQSVFENGMQRDDKAAMHEGAEKYLALLRAECLPLRPNLGDLRCDEVAYNAGVAFIAAGDPASAERVKAIMLDPKNGMSKSPLAAKLACRLANTCP